MIWSGHILTHALAAVAGAGVCCLVLWWRDRYVRKVRALETEALLGRVRNEAEVITRDARLAASTEARQLLEQTEQSFAARRTERAESERRLAEREALINSQLARVVESEKALDERKAALRKHEAELQSRERDLAELARQGREQLQRMACLSQEQAREALLKRIEQETLSDANSLSRRILEEAKSKAEEKARQIITVAIQRYAGEHTFESTTATVALQGDDIKGRIIGREGRNIRAFESATGVTVLIDDTPGAVLLSGFDPVRREIAREAMARLIADGRIHPTRIEEVVAKVSQEMDDTIVRLGEAAVLKAGLPPMHADIVKLLGRLHFRHSYSQNILDHSVEVAHLAGMMAGELGLDATAARRAGLLHDLGKAIPHEVQGPHALVGADFLKRYGETDAVVNGVASHHNDVAPAGPLGILVSAADAISASRPGARSETMTTYLKRIEDLERIATGFPGVEKAFAAQAGRELRVLVKPEEVDDEGAYTLARQIVAKIQNDLQYPGQIRLIVIRETRCVEVAK
jgi:ribonuclease Y